MRKFITLDGVKTGPTDPERGVWYSADCTFWTDDWSKLNTRGGIPCCPNCGCPGMQTTAGDWSKGIEAFEAKDFEAKNNNIGYANFIAGLKNNCRGRGASVASLWRLEKEKNA